MKLRTALLLLAFCSGYTSYSQAFISFADSVRKAYHIPEIGIAVVSSSTILELDVIGEKKIGSGRPAAKADRFRIGSNTKTVTGFIAAQLVKEGKISWNTKFFDLFPEMKAKGNPAYYDLTLLNLLSFRTRLIKYTYTDAAPEKEQFSGNEDRQRYQFMEWSFAQKPVPKKGERSFSNLGYVAAGLMLEKVTGKTYKQLANALGTSLGIDFQFGAPNTSDTMQTWGHNAQLQPEPPADNYKLEWLLAAGNINVSLPDYSKFIQLQLKGLAGHSDLLTAKEFEFLHYGLPGFAVGWFWETEDGNVRYSHHTGNPGTFLSEVYVYAGDDRGYILFANVQSAEAEEGMSVMLDAMKTRFGK
jgi:CubicO group peptidase (beta-lactamase class C family)